MSKLKTEYRGYEIEWSDYHKALIIKHEDKSATDKLFYNTGDCEKWIDEQYRNKFRRVEVYEKTLYDDLPYFREGFVNELSENHEHCQFIDRETGRETTQHRGYLFPITDHNTAIFYEIELKKKAISNLEKRIQELMEKMVALQTGDVGISEGENK